MKDMFCSPTIGAGVDFTSGDDATTADKAEGFDNLYYTAHSWNGYMDYFSPGAASAGVPVPDGLMDIFIKLKLQMNEDMHAKLMFHLFSTTDPDMDDTGLGNEIDLVLSDMIMDNLACDLGLGYFMPSEDWVGPDMDSGMWLYLQLTTMFDMEMK